MISGASIQPLPAGYSTLSLEYKLMESWSLLILAFLRNPFFSFDIGLS